MSVASPVSTTNSKLPSEQQKLADVGYMTCMTLTLLGNYAQTGHFGGPLAYTPFNVATHLSGPDAGGLRYDYRRPKHPHSDKFMLAAGHCAPTCYALWMIMGEALYRKYQATGDRRYYVAPETAMLSVDALGFRRGAGALKTLLSDQGLSDHPLFAQAKGRGIRALSGHIESTDFTNDVNGGPSGVGVATAAGKAAFWDMVGAPMGSPKVVAFEGEFAMCAGHAQELKTQAIALQVGKRLRIFFSDNNAGIDDALIGGVVHRKFEGYRLIDQWTSYGWNVLSIPDGHDYNQILGVLKTMEDWDPARPASDDRLRKNDKGLLAGRSEWKVTRRGPDRWLSESSVRIQDELGILCLAGKDVRRSLWCSIRRHPRWRCHRSAGTPHSVQDQYGCRDVRSRTRWPRRLVGRSSGGNRRHGEGRFPGSYRRQTGSVSRRSASRVQPSRGAAVAHG